MKIKNTIYARYSINFMLLKHAGSLYRLLNRCVTRGQNH